MKRKMNLMMMNMKIIKIKIIVELEIEVKKVLKLIKWIYINCFWNVLVTMTTVGYGDIYPETTLGRIVGCAIATSGNIVVALIITFFQEQTYLEIEEKNALEFMQRVNEKEEIMKDSAKYFKANMLYMIQRSASLVSIMSFGRLTSVKFSTSCSGMASMKSN